MIGDWLVRHEVAHLVDSEVADRVVMRCGRELAKALLRPAQDDPTCAQCDPVHPNGEDYAERYQRMVGPQ